MIGKYDLPKFAMRNKSELSNSQNAGCYHCLAVFPAKEIVDWTDDGKTAICPKCQVDSVIAEMCGYELSVASLKRAQEYWF